QTHCAYCHGDSESRRYAILRNATAELNVRGRSLILAGADDPSGPHAATIPSVGKGETSPPFRILLLPSVRDLDAPGLRQYALVLTGDTRGGQIDLPHVTSLWAPKGTRT